MAQVHHLLKGIKSPELEVFCTQLEMYGIDFDTTMSYLCRMVAQKGLIMQSVLVVKTRSQPVRLKVMTFTRKVECKEYPKPVDYYHCSLQALTRKNQVTAITPQNSLKSMSSQKE